MLWEKGKDKKVKLKCICLREHKLCDRDCEKDKVDYNQYQDIIGNFKNERIR